MNNQLVYSATPMTVGAVAIMATFGGVNEDLPELAPPVVIVDQATLLDGQLSDTFGSTTANVSKASDELEAEFSIRLAAIYATLSEGQEPLGEEFEAIWDANTASLYEA